MPSYSPPNPSSFSPFHLYQLIIYFLRQLSLLLPTLVIIFFLKKTLLFTLIIIILLISSCVPHQLLLAGDISSCVPSSVLSYRNQIIPLSISAFFSFNRSKNTQIRGGIWFLHKDRPEISSTTTHGYARLSSLVPA